MDRGVVPSPGGRCFWGPERSHPVTPARGGHSLVRAGAGHHGGPRPRRCDTLRTLRSCLQVAENRLGLNAFNKLMFVLSGSVHI